MTYLEIASLLGTFAFAVSGAIIGIRKELDLMGVFILSFLTGAGGGILRDLLLSRTPSILINSEPFIIIFSIMLFIKAFRLNEKYEIIETKWIFRLSDTIGLVAFAISGAIAAIEAEVTIFGVIVISFLTAVGGGIIRDILVNEVPEILKSGFYGSVAVLVGISIYLTNHFEIDKAIAIPTIFLLGIFLRIIAIKKDFELPKI